MTSELISSLVWPLGALLAALLAFYFFRKLQVEFQPLFRGIVAGLAVHAQTYASAYAMAALIGTAASLQELANFAREQNWVFLEGLARVVQPGIVSVIAFIHPAPASNGNGNSKPPPPSSPVVPSNPQPQ